ncbi:hypothetical protein [Paenibacillus sp. N3.4]|uniref:hypothetical protein n=1 Tax=Paenibacillus sp. N3.4 TaxID=2603222 RepID=UPI0011C99839|nr:hypothetical protein [Paenibacillus sp. N3.4]TXK85771.1 hypothetical protein FU659_02370 [Paenibacillus sp. N3.4]
MEEKKFIAYTGDYRVHDSKIEGILWENENLSVFLRSYKGEALVVRFYGVKTIHSNRPLGMMLYAISEMKCHDPLRKFIFGNWDERDDASLEIVAEQVDFKSKVNCIE